MTARKENVDGSKNQFGVAWSRMPCEVQQCFTLQATFFKMRLKWPGALALENNPTLYPYVLHTDCVENYRTCPIVYHLIFYIIALSFTLMVTLFDH